MRYTLPCLAALGLSGLAATPAGAGCYGGSFYAPTYKAAVVKVVEKVYTPVAVFAVQPVYVGAYAVPAAPAAPAPAAAKPALAPDAVQTLMTELRGLKAQMDQMRRGHAPPPAAAPKAGEPPAAPAPAPAGPDPQAMDLWRAKCAACHREDVAAREGGDFTLLTRAGERAKLSFEQLQATVKHILGNTMPKVPNKHGIAKLTDVEATVLLEDLKNWSAAPPPEPPALGGRLLIRAGEEAPPPPPARRVVRRRPN